MAPRSLLLVTPFLVQTCGSCGADDILNPGGGDNRDCEPSFNGMEICDARDNDCNGQVDDKCQAGRIAEMTPFKQGIEIASMFGVLSDGTVAALGPDGHVRFVGPDGTDETGEEAPLDVHTLTTSPDGRLLAVGRGEPSNPDSRMGFVTELDADSGAAERTLFESPVLGIDAAAMDSAGDLYVVTSTGTADHELQTATGAVLQSITPLQGVFDHASLAIGADANLYACAGDSILKTEGGPPQEVVSLRRGTCLTVAADASGNLYYTIRGGSDDAPASSLMVFDPVTRVPSEVVTARGRLLYVASNPEGDGLVLGAHDAADGAMSFYTLNTP